MSSTATRRHATTSGVDPEIGYRPGPLGRLGVLVTRHARLTTVVWLLVVVGLGAFAPRVETELSGAGWQADGSESVAARELAQEHFGGNASTAIQVVVHSTDGPVTSGPGKRALARATALLEKDPRIAQVLQPQPGATLSKDGTTAVLVAGANADPNEMVRVADDLKGPLQALSTSGVQVDPTGASLLWSDFNEANLSAMLKSEMFSWPVTLAILVLAFGALVAAGLPLILTMAGLVASAGSLVLINHLVPVSIWAMNFAMMFALALGIDYALFLVVRFRAARLGHHENARRAIAETMDTAGKAVLLSGATVLISLSAVMLVPSPSFRSMAGGIMLSVLFVLAATLTLLPLVLFKLDHRINRFALPWVRTGEHRSPAFAKWGEILWRHPIAFGSAALVILVALAAPIIGLKTAMPSIKVLPSDASARVGYDLVQRAFGDGAPGTLTIVVDKQQAVAASAVLAHDAGISGAMPAVPAQDGSDHALIQAVPTVDPSAPGLATTVDRLRADLPSSALVGGAAVENLDLKTQLDASTPLVIGVILALGFLLLLIALQAP
ncbi:MAG: MMPL family transporter, partial [Nocardioides sp.]